MFGNFKIHCKASNIEVQPISLAQSPPALTTPLKQMESDTLLDSVAKLSKINGMTVVQHGARLAVIGELLASMLMHLPASMQVDIANAFRARIEDLMSLSDDRCLPEKYHSALLTEVNRYLNALR